MRALSLLVLTVLLAALVVGLVLDVGARLEPGARAAAGRPGPGPGGPAHGLPGSTLAAPAADGEPGRVPEPGRAAEPGRAPEPVPHEASSSAGAARAAPTAELRGLEDGERPPPLSFPGSAATPERSDAGPRDGARAAGPHGSGP